MARRCLRRAIYYSAVSILVAGALLLALLLGSPTALGTLGYQILITLLLLAPLVYFDLRSKRIPAPKGDSETQTQARAQSEAKLYLLDVLHGLFTFHLFIIAISLL